MSKGASITGASAEVDQFVSHMTKLNEQQLGDTKAVMIYGSLNDDQLAAAKQRGLDVGPVSLQDLFIHLTSEEN